VHKPVLPPDDFASMGPPKIGEGQNNERFRRRILSEKRRNRVPGKFGVNSTSQRGVLWGIGKDMSARRNSLVSEEVRFFPGGGDKKKGVYESRGFLAGSSTRKIFLGGWGGEGRP